jgi:MFS transporter, ACS family, D-galactonate transporter
MEISLCIYGFCTLGYLGAFARWYQEPLSPPGAMEAPDSLFDTVRLPLTSMLQYPQVLGMALVMLAYNYAFYLTLAWLPTFLVQKLHIGYSRAFFITGIPWLFATAVEIAVGGYLTDWIIGRSSRPARARLWIIAIGLSCGVCLFALPLIRTPFAAIWMLSLAIGGNAAATPCIWSAPSLIAPKSNVATVGGIMNFSAQIGGNHGPSGHRIPGVGYKVLRRRVLSSRGPFVGWRLGVFRPCERIGSPRETAGTCLTRVNRTMVVNAAFVAPQLPVVTMSSRGYRAIN